MDIYLVNSGQCDFFAPNPPLRNALYHKQIATAPYGCNAENRRRSGSFGQGVAVGDYDGMAFPDLYVTQLAESILYHNNSDGTFTDVTEKAGVAAPGWAPAPCGSTTTMTAVRPVRLSDSWTSTIQEQKFATREKMPNAATASSPL